MEFEENQPDGFDLGVEITAEDPDTTADLIFSINWDGSYATKNGRRLPDIDEYKGFVN